MVTLKTLLGSRSEVHYECMYTKNKTQKRKVWHDGFVSLSAPRKLVLFEDMPPDGAFCQITREVVICYLDDGVYGWICIFAGKVIDEAKMTPYDWDRKDEALINVPKFLVEIINETPINIQGSGGGASSYSAYSKPTKAESVARDEDLSPPRSMNSKIKVPVSSGSGGPPPRLGTRPGGSRQPPLGRSGNAKPLHAVNKNIFDFDRNPTSEWEYQPNAINRSVERERRSRLALGERDRLPRVLGAHERLRVEHVVVLLDLEVAAAAPVDAMQLVEHDAEQHGDDPREHVEDHFSHVHDWEAAGVRGQRERA